MVKVLEFCRRENKASSYKVLEERASGKPSGGRDKGSGDQRSMEHHSLPDSQ